MDLQINILLTVSIDCFQLFLKSIETSFKYLAPTYNFK